MTTPKKDEMSRILDKVARWMALKIRGIVSRKRGIPIVAILLLGGYLAVVTVQSLRSFSLCQELQARRAHVKLTFPSAFLSVPEQPNFKARLLDAGTASDIWRADVQETETLYRLNGEAVGVDAAKVRAFIRDTPPEIHPHVTLAQLKDENQRDQCVRACVHGGGEKWFSLLYIELTPQMYLAIIENGSQTFHLSETQKIVDYLGAQFAQLDATTPPSTATDADGVHE